DECAVGAGSNRRCGCGAGEGQRYRLSAQTTDGATYGEVRSRGGAVHRHVADIGADGATAVAYRAALGRTGNGRNRIVRARGQVRREGEGTVSIHRDIAVEVQLQRDRRSESSGGTADRERVIAA